MVLPHGGMEYRSYRLQFDEFFIAQFDFQDCKKWHLKSKTSLTDRINHALGQRRVQHKLFEVKVANTK